MSEYDLRAEAWVRAKYPDAHPDSGSVEFTSDVAGYASGGWAEMTVDWKENGNPRSRELGGWGEFDWTVIIRELLEIDLTQIKPL